MTRLSTLTHNTRRRTRTFLLATACCGIVIAVLPRAAFAADPVVLAGGDVACDTSSANFNGGSGTATACRQKATTDLIMGQAFDAVLALGDQQYETGAFSAYQAVYGSTWGRFKAKTYPIIGNHDGETATSGDGYCRYFGAIAHCNASGQQGGAGFYSFNLGAWHIVMLNSNCIAVGGCGVGSPEYTWLQSDLAANPRSCKLAAWHHPRWTSGFGYDGKSLQPLWKLFYDGGGDLVLSGHLHTYERFARMNGDGAIDPVNGMREFVVGTGGESFHAFGATAPGSEVRQNATFGVLKLVLHPASYDWTFLPIAVSTFTDSGSSQPCRRVDTTPPSPPTPTPVVQPADQARGASQTGVPAGGGQAADGKAAAHQSAKQLAHWRVKAAGARRALARGRIRIPARRWAPTVIEVRVGGRLAVVRSTPNKDALTLRLPSWAKGSRYRHRAVTIRIIQPAGTAAATH